MEEEVSGKQRSSKILWRKRVEALCQRIQAAQEEMKKIQEQCSHPEECVEKDKRECGFDGYATNYTTYYNCKICRKHWVIG